AISEVTGQKELTGPKHGIHGALALLQKKLSFLPDYSFGKPAGFKQPGAPAPRGDSRAQKLKEHTYEVNWLGTGVSGIVGGALTLGLSLLIGLLLKMQKLSRLKRR
ncbi:MAG: PDGLE domain-containing protein, partial [Desulfuromonadaceae bacterium]